MTTEAAINLLNGPAEVDFEALAMAFRAFGFSSDSPNFETEVYYHASYLDCGFFTARDTGHRVLSPHERMVVLRMLECVRFRAWAHRRTPH